MPEITIVEVEERRAAETVLAPNSNAPVALREGDLIGEEFARAAEPLRRLVVDAGRPSGADGGTGEAVEIGETVVMDRRYLDDFRSDMHDCDDLMVQQQVYLDPRAGRAMSSLLEPSTHRDRATVPDIAGDPADHYRCALERHGIGAIVVDITTPDVASTGMRVVRVIAPGTVGNAPAAFPYLGRRRVQDLAVELGWRERVLDEDRLNYFPLPHA